jgi:hypothetical protein
LAALFGRTTADLGLDAIELGDARQRLGGDRRGAGHGKLVELSAHMRLMPSSA